MNKKNKITLILLCSILAFCVVSAAGVLIWRKTAEKALVSEEIVVEGGKASASDEAALRELLLKEEEIVITLTEDVTVDESFIVNGKKTLTGSGSIKMALYVLPYENLITVAENASFILDGVTVNGNGIANGVKVEKNANLTLLSGEVVWGNPYGIEVQGNAEIKGGTVTDAIHTGVYIGTSGHVEMSAGTIKSARYCSTRISKGGYFALSEDGTLINCGVYHIQNAGTCDVTGGVVRDSKYSLAATEGELNIHYQGNDDGMIEWYNATGSGVWVGEGGSLNASGFYVHDVVYAGVNSGQGIGTINLTNCRFENVGNSGLRIKTATAELKDVEIYKPGKHGVFISSPATVANIENLTVTEPAERGLHNAGGMVTAKNVTVTSPGTYGVSTGILGDVKGSLTVENLTVTGAGSNPDNVQPAVNSYNSVLTVNGATITDSNGVGARATDGGEITLKNVKIDKTESYGIYVLHDKTKATIENVSVTNSGKHGVYVNNAGAKANINNLTVTNAEGRGIHNAGGTITAKKVTITSPALYGVSTGSYTDKKTNTTTAGSVTVDNLTVTGAKGDSGVNSYKSVLNVTNGKITDSAKVGARVTDGGTMNLTDVEITTTGYEGVFVNSEGQATLKNVTVTGAGKHGVYVNGAGSKAEIDTLTVAEPAERGLHNAGGTITAKNVTITSPGLYGVSTGNYTDAEGNVTAGSVTVNNLTVTGAKGDSSVNAYKSVLTVTNGKINDSAKVGARVTDGGTLNLTDVEIGATGTGYEGVLVKSAGQANLKNVSVANAGKHGVYVNGAGSKAEIDTLIVTKPTERGVHNAGGTITAKNVTITKPGTYGVSTGNLDNSLGSVTVTNLTVTEAQGDSAVNSYNSALTVTNATISKPAKVGARVTDGGTLTLTNVEITNAGEHGVYVNGVGSTSFIDTLTVTNAAKRGLYNVGGTVTAKDVTTETSGEYGVSLAAHTDESKNVTRAAATITGLTVKGTDTVAGAMSHNSDLVINGGTISKTKTHGAVSAGTGDLKLTDVSISDTGSNGVQIETNCTATLTGVTVTDAGIHGVYTQVGSTSTITNLTVTDCAERGLYVVGGTVTGENVTTNSTGKYGVSVGADDNTRGNVTITGLTVNGTEANSGVMANKSDVTINGGTITGTKTDGAVSAATGDLKLTNVSISGAGRDGVRIETNCTASLTGVTITDAAEHGAYAMVGSTSTIMNLTVTDCVERGVYAVGGTVTGENITTNSTGKYGISAGASGSTRATINITGLTVNGTDANSGIMASKSDVTINGGTITGTKTDGAVSAATGDLKLTNVSINEAGRNGVQVEKSSTATLTGVTVMNAKKHGLYNEGGTVTGENVTITTPEIYGVYTVNKDDVKGSVTLTGLNVTGAKVNVPAENATTVDGALFADNSTLTVIGTETAKTIADSNKNGAGVVNGGTLNLTNVAITNAKRHGVYVAVGSTATVKGLTVTDCVERGVYAVGGTVTGENITTNSTGKYGISAGASGSTRANINITGLTVNGTDANPGVMAHNSDMTINGGTITGTKTDGAVAASTGTLIITNVSINEAGRNGVQVEKSSTATLTGVTIANAKNHGLYNIGGTVTGENVTITSPEVYAVYTINKDNVKGSVTLTGLNVTGAKVNVPAEDATTVDGALFADNSTLTVIGTETAKTIADSNKNGAGVVNGGTLNLTNVAITNAKRHGVYVSVGSTATVKGLTVTDCTNRGVYVVGGTVTGENVTTNSTGQYGISAGASGSTRATIIITGLTVNGTDAYSGIMAHNSDVTINGGTITGTKTDGVTAASAGVANLTDVSISNTGRDGVRVETNSTANLTRVTFSNCAAKETYKTATSATINVLE